MKIFPSLCAMAALCAAAGPAAHGGTPWFDAGVAGLEDWPADGSDLAVPGMGTWHGTEFARLSSAAAALDVLAPDGAELSFVPRSARDFAAGGASVRSTMSFVPLDWLPDPPADAKAAILAAAPDGGAPRFYAAAKDPDGATNVWTALAGVVPVEDAPAEVVVSFATVGGRPVVQYAVDGVALENGAGESWLETAAPDTELASAGIRGRSVLSALSGEAESVPDPATFTIPALEHMTLVSVTAAGAPIAPTGGVYTVEEGTPVVVTFAPEDGYVLDRAAMEFVVRGDMELPAEGRPSAFDVKRVVRINEVGASNGTTVRTAGGGEPEGLDWVELRNDADFAVDLAGWYLSDNPTKAQAKWEKIQGACVVPARGFKIVWCDKSYDGFLEGEAYSRIGLSSDGEALFLATPGGTFADGVENFGRQIKDVSWGLGHLSRTVLPASAEAEYRVGGAGDWTTVHGPVGMSAEAGGFKTVAYKMVSGKTISNMDKAEEYLRDPAAWDYVSTNENLSVIAFREGSSNGSFSGYTEYPGVGGDQFIVVVSGAVMVPRSGLWTFAVGSDDGFSARLSRLGESWSWENRGTRGYAQSPAVFNLEAGVYDVEIVYFEYNGGAAFDFSVAEGEATPFDQHASQFRLVGSAESGVLHAGALGAQVAADLSGEMPGVSAEVQWRATFAMPAPPDTNDAVRLRIRYADGFAARLNGTEFARVEAAGARAAAEAMDYAYFEIPRGLVAAGANLLEVTGFNDDLDDTEFFLSPEVVWEIDEDQYVYFPAPTPGAPNLAGGRTGFTPPVAMSEPRGWKTEPFDLALSCPENPAAAIYYTLDGSSPVAGRPNTFRYEAPFNVSSTAVVRAAVPDADSILQADTTCTYLFLDDILATPRGVVPAGFPASQAVNNQKMVYGMETNAIAEKGETDGSTRERLLRGFTNSIPVLSIATEPENLFDRTTGIYVNATGNGRGWERPVMVEQIDPTNPANEFDPAPDKHPGGCAPAGLRIRGAYSRGSGIPKHSFRLFFRSEYGASKLKHPMFGDEGVSSFDKLDLRTEQNYAWSNGSGWETFVHEIFSRDSERDMGTTYNRGRYLHLFINGVYWGLYQTEERVDDYYAESYNGGSAVNYDVIRTSQPGYNTGVAEGDAEAYTEFWRITTQEGYGASHPDNYNRVRGLNPDGSRNPDYPVYLDVTNLVDHVMVAHFVADSDSPVSVGSSGMANNIIAFRDRIDGDSDSDGFKWNRHDAEHSLSRGNGANAALMASTNILLYGTRALYSKNLAVGNFNPYEIHYELCANPEYRTVFADQVYKHVLREGGALTTTNAVLRFRARMAEIDDAIVCEAARWGHVPSQRRRSDWLKSCQDCLNFIEARVPILVANYRALGWYPSIDAPAVTNALGERLLGGETVGAGARVFATGGEGGTVYYTTDGSDPRLEGGAVNDASAAAFPLAEGLEVPAEGVSLKLRVLSPEGEWSALEELSLAGESVAFAPLADALRVAALYTSTDGDGDTGEFVVLTNLDATASVDLSGARLVAWNAKKQSEAKPSLTIAFDAVTIGSGESLALEQATAFGGGKLTNSRVGLRLYDATNALVQDCIVDADWWGKACDGTGAHFVAKEFGNVVTNRWQWKPTATALPDALRVAAVYSSTAGDGGDTGEFVVLTNLSASAKIDLADLRLVAWNAKKKSEADPSLVIDFTNELEVAAGGAVTLDQAAWFGTGKLTNSKVGLRLYDAAGALVQDALVDADWWNKACDGTGAHFVALATSAVAKNDADWAPSFPLVADAAARAAVADAVASDARIKPWLDAWGATPDGAAA
ncbi:MAG: CotH kinase family protein, partial [Kiritimatiellae bacterium]|nr:CotH kinase family protein [Kiritimatiellia bacterium]